MTKSQVMMLISWQNMTERRGGQIPSQKGQVQERSPGALRYISGGGKEMEIQVMERWSPPSPKTARAPLFEIFG